ncbi:MAG: TetR/AcrR family transcriptional regulator [Gemmatimonadaceae bacterium]
MVPAYASQEKRSFLIGAAKRLLHQQGFGRTTLADVASSADVPLGNVYYYFKTKEALAEAVISSHESDLRTLFAGWVSAHRDPKARLRRLVRAPLDFADAIMAFGCPHGSLCQELEKLGADAPLAAAGSRLLAVYIDWAEAQFRELGFVKRGARAQAAELVASVQGTILVAHSLRSRELLASQLRRVERRLDATLARRRPS